jgi:hypothetical protein
MATKSRNEPGLLLLPRILPGVSWGWGFWDFPPGELPEHRRRTASSGGGFRKLGFVFLGAAVGL